MRIHSYIVKLTLLDHPGWNRQSVRLFAGFNTFESPRDSQAQRRAEREDDDDYSSSPGSPSNDRRFLITGVYSFEKKLPEPPYHVFSLAQKKQMVYIVSLAGLFSLLSSSIYFPALGQILQGQYSIHQS
jgi:hypothetical protein